MGVKDEISEMLESYGNFETDAETEEDSGNDSTESPATDSPASDAPATEGPATDAPSTDTPATIAPSTAPSTSAPTTEAPPKEFDFLEDDDLDELIDDKDKFNKLLNKIYLKGVEYSRREFQKIAQDIMANIPNAVQANFHAIETVRRAADGFYKDNPDLKEHSAEVRGIFDDLMKKNPRWTYAKLLKETEVAARKKLKLPKPTKAAEPPDDDDPRPPRLPRPKGQRRQPTKSPSKSPVLDELSAMDEALNRR